MAKEDKGLEALQWPLIVFVGMIAIAMLSAAINAKDVCSFP